MQGFHLVYVVMTVSFSAFFWFKAWCLRIGLDMTGWFGFVRVFELSSEMCYVQYVFVLECVFEG